MQLIIGDFPEACKQPTRAFKKTSVHFASPFTIKSSLRRNASMNKAYANLWIIFFITKAVQIELIGNLTT